MDDDYTPTTEEVMKAAGRGPTTVASAVSNDRFQSWLADHDAATIRQAGITAVRTYADQLGVYIGDEDSEFYRGYRQAQREAIQRAERYLDQLAAGGDQS